MRLKTLPEVSRIGIMIILAELGGGVSNFKFPKALSSWAWLRPGNNESAGKRCSGKTKPGNVKPKRQIFFFDNQAKIEAILPVVAINENGAFSTGKHRIHNLYDPRVG
ncbi:MAG: IS110 family transposase [Deltaproteobacteria bacterium]|nr:IS110 family transposase [Deltaproteobacteria bacterium]